MTLFGPIQVYMAPMMTVSGPFCGRSYYGCAPSGPWHGV